LRRRSQTRHRDHPFRPLGLQHAVPLAHKDFFYRAGAVCTCGSRIRAGWVADRTAAVLARLDAAGALKFERLGMSEFAVGQLGLNAHYEAVRNPWNWERVSGGSSSGAGAAAVPCFGAWDRIPAPRSGCRRRLDQRCLQGQPQCRL
jgi:Asp-tRNA(Asn)/Glu-tRNA(Gln) amidotransferase A subunit family amidase